MPLVPAKCTQCGSNLNVDASQEAAVCPFCHTPFITEKAIHNYNITNVTNIDNLHADVVNVMSSDNPDNLFKTGTTFVQMKDYNSATTTFSDMCRKYPYDPRGWYGSLMTISSNFGKLQLSNEYFSKAVELYDKCLISQKQNAMLDAQMQRNLAEYMSCIEAQIGKHICVTRKEEVDRIQAEYTSTTQNWQQRLAEHEDKLKGVNRKYSISKGIFAFLIGLTITAGITFIVVAIVSIFLSTKGDAGTIFSMRDNTFELHGTYYDFWRNLYDLRGGNWGKAIFSMLLTTGITACVVALICYILHKIGDSLSSGSLYAWSKLRKDRETTEADIKDKKERSDEALTNYNTDLKTYQAIQKKLSRIQNNP